MIVDLDGFFPVRPGSDGYYRTKVGNGLDVRRLDENVARVVTAALLTDGFTPRQWGLLLTWGGQDQWQPHVDYLLRTYGDEDQVVDLARRNASSVTEADGLDWLRVVLRRRPWYRAEVPVWTRRALRDLREKLNGGSAAVAKVLEEDRKVALGPRWRARRGAWIGLWIADVR